MSKRIEYFFFYLLKRVVLLMPLRSAQRLGVFLGTVSYFVVWKRRAVALENLQSAFPEKSLRERKTIAHRAFQNYGITMLEFMWFPNFNLESLRKIFVDTDLTVVHACYNRGKGMVVVSAHMSNWELMALALSVASGLPVSIVAQAQANEQVNDAINADRTMFGNKIVQMGISVREVVKALQRKEIVALAADQSGPQESPYVEFFGRLTATHQGPAVFALRMKAPMLLVLAIRNSDGTYKAVFEEIPTGDLEEYNDANVTELTARHVRVLEKYIRQYPDQWLWMHRRWKHSIESGEKTVKDGAFTNA
jgi:Kdo2-lipid IVA lauroyltransferase/acyltransferase